jgi:hypothetical protein
MTGAEDFNFLYGRWRVHNRKLVDPARRGGTDWVEFMADADVRPVVGGLGNMDTFVVTDLPGVGAYEGMSLRLFDPERRVWRIWWASTRRPGHLDTPVEGGFADGRGAFTCNDEINGQPIRVRFEWLDVTMASPRWVQSFSFDGGATWEANWVMTLSRSS